MNKRIHSLIFDRRRGMRVPAGEHVRSAGKPASGNRRAVAVAAALVVSAGGTGGVEAGQLGVIQRAAALMQNKQAQSKFFNLPQPSNGANGRNFLASGNAGDATQTVEGTKMTIKQIVSRVALNWESFDIGAGYTVRFEQPTGGSALNYIWDAKPSLILGNLEANGEIILQNTNGVIFGSTAKVDTGKLVATSLQLTRERFESGLRNVTDGSVVFGGDDANPEGYVVVEKGARITGGEVLIFAPRVRNEGEITTNGGQTVLAAGKKIYLASSLDPAQRGLLVAVDAADGDDPERSMVENVGKVLAERGTINLVGMVVKQNGTLSATTAVKGQNGSIYLQAQKSTSAELADVPRAAGTSASGGKMRVAAETGTLIVGGNSVTEVTPFTSSDTATDSENFYPSVIRMEGGDIHLESGAKVIAPSGRIEIAASRNPALSPYFLTTAEQQNKVAKPPQADDSRIVIDSGVTISTAGLRGVSLPMERNQLSGRLFRNELKDSPLQRSGPLYRALVELDGRLGTSVADVLGFSTGIARTAAEKSTTGGSISIRADGDVVIGDGARIDASGGSVHYEDGSIRTTLLRVGNKIVKVSDADKSVRYDEVIQPTLASIQPGYDEGKDAGSVTLAGKRLYVGRDTLKADVVVGARQLAGLDAMPRAGQLNAGYAYTDAANEGTLLAQMQGITLTQALTRRADASVFDKDGFASASLDWMANGMELSADDVMAGGFGEVRLSAQRVHQQSGSVLDLGRGGVFGVTSGSASLDGTVRAPGGSIEILARAKAGEGDITLGSQAWLTTAGLWVNPQNGSDRLFDAIDGGSISVKARDSIFAAQGSRIDVSAGARNGSSVTYGDAGSVTLAVYDGAVNNADLALSDKKLALGAELSGFGFSGGGKLTLNVADLSIGSNAAGFVLDPAFFSEHGFADIGIKALHGDVTIAPGTLIDMQLHNRLLASGARLQATGDMSASVARVATLEAARRDPVNLSITAAYKGTGPTDAGGKLSIGQGARVSAEAGATLKFAAEGALTLAGTLSAPGGNIELTLAPNTRRGNNAVGETGDLIGFLPDQAIWLTDTAKILAAGTAEVETDALGRRTGTVWGGGNVKLTAQRGYVVAAAGSEIDVSGYATTLNPGGSLQQQAVSRDAGSLAVSTREGFALDGTIRAQKPNDLASGGKISLTVGLDTTASTLDPATGQPYPSDPRQILIRSGNGTALGAAAPGDALDAVLGNGTGHVYADRLKASGFDQIALSADNRIVFDGAVMLSAGQSIQLNSPVLAAADGSGATARIAAPYVALGNQASYRYGDAYVAGAADGTAGLQVDAALIDVINNLSLQGFANTELRATRAADGSATRRDGEIRLRGIVTDEPVNGKPDVTLDGNLRFAGELTLQAGQTYATSLSNFKVEGTAGSTFTTLMPGASADGKVLGSSTSAMPLSALGQLSVSADDIVHKGVLRQPFGSITLSATESLALGAGSEISASGLGLTVPVGTTVNGSSWIYQPWSGDRNDGGSTINYATLNGLPVAKEVKLTSKVVSIDPSAKVSAAGGGDLQAWEFVPGTGGSTDYLNTKGVYAVVKDYGYDYAPYDAAVAAAGNDPAIGQQIVVTSAGSGLEPGRYTLLPARYALLAGARSGVYVVSLASDQGNGLAMATAAAQPDGSSIVTGYFSTAATQVQNDSAQRFVVEAPAVYLAKSEYRVSGINGFLTDYAHAHGSGQQVLPKDAGRISLKATEPFSLGANIDLSAPTGALAGQLDLALARLVLVDDLKEASLAKVPEGYTAVSVDQLSKTQAGSVLLGGTRSGVENVSVQTVATDVQVLSNKAVSAGEVILVGSKTVSIGDNAKLQAAGATIDIARTVTLSGDGALAMVSNNKGVELTRSGATRADGVLSIGKGAALGGASVQLDATQSLGLASDASITAGSIGIGAGRISLGGASPEGDATVLDGMLLGSVRSASRAQLRSYSSIDFIGKVALDMASNGTPTIERLVLDAPALRGLAENGTAADVSIRAQDVVLRNGTGTQLDAAGSGTLRIEAQPPLRYGRTGGITLAAGQQHLGFGQSTLVSQGDVVFQGSGKLKAQGDLKVESQRVTAATAAAHGIEAAGVLTLSQVANGHTLNERVGQGAKIDLKALRIAQNGSIDLPSGVLTLTATGADLVEKDGSGQVVKTSAALGFGAGSTTRAGGFAVQAGDDWTLYGNAGRIAARAEQGSIRVDGTLDVAAHADGGDAGRLELQASKRAVTIAGTAVLKGGKGAGADDLAGSFSLDAANLGQGVNSELSGLAAKLNAGGFNRAVDLRVRTGDLTQAAGSTLRAERVVLSADAGNVKLAGAIDANAAQGGVVQVWSGKNLDLSGTITAQSTRVGANGGDVLLSAGIGTQPGTLTIADGATIDARGTETLKRADGSSVTTVDAADGRIVLRAQRDGTDVKIAAFGANGAAGLKAAEVDVEAVRVYDGVTAVATGATTGSVLGQANVSTDNNNFMVGKGDTLTRLNLAGASNVHLTSGVEIRGSGDIELRNDWNLASAGDEPIYLTVRAGGNLDVKGSLSDGFVNATRSGAIESGRAASFRLTGGADLQSANALSVLPSTIAGDVVVSGDKMIRTTSGSIEIAAGRDVSLLASSNKTGAPGVVYVAGRLVDDLGTTSFVAPDKSVFTSHGGRLEVLAERDVVSAQPAQFMVNWFDHTGTMSMLDPTQFSPESNLAWWSRFDIFKQGLGSFGGGNLVVSAGRNVQDLSVVSPTSAYMDSPAPDASKLTINNGGDITIRAEGDIKGGQYFLGRGKGHIQTEGSLTVGSKVASLAGTSAAVAEPATAAFALMDGQWSVDAGGDVTVGVVFNPTMLSGRADTNLVSASYITYASDSSFSASSAGKSVTWVGTGSSPSTNEWKLYSALANSSGSVANERVALVVNSGDYALMQLAPPKLELDAFGGGVSLKGAVLLSPSPKGDLHLYANGSVALGSQIRMLDDPIDSLPSLLNTTYTNPNIDRGDEPLVSVRFDYVGQDSRRPFSGNAVDKIVFSNLHAADRDPIRIYAGANVTGRVEGAISLLVPKLAVIEAGGDITGFTMAGQHHSSDDETVVRAGGSILGKQVSSPTPLVTLAGPGTLSVEAGLQLDLGAGGGLKTIGNIYNRNLSSQGASLRLAAGMKGEIKLETFAQRYLSDAAGGSSRSAINRNALIAFVASELNLEGLSDYDRAWDLFQSFPVEAQTRFAQRHVLPQEFAAAYLAPGQRYAQAWQQAAAAAGVDPDSCAGQIFESFRERVVYAEQQRAGDLAAGSGITAAQRQGYYNEGFKVAELAGLGDSFAFNGDISLVKSKAITSLGGDILLLAPGGSIDVGAAGEKNGSDASARAAERGLVAYAGGNIRSFSNGDFNVNAQKVFVVGKGDITIWSANGSIDAGRGANTTISIPALIPIVTDDGVVFELPPLTTGSGIGILQTPDGKADGNVGLYAPRGEVRALDAQIRAPGNIAIAAPVVRGADNISGGSVSAPAAPSVSVAVSAPTGQSDTGNKTLNDTAGGSGDGKPRDRNSLLTVELVGLGDGLDNLPPTAAGEKSEGDKPCEPGDKRAKCQEKPR